ncbi:MAG: sigma-70 family RNA polymerase sigma factor [Bacteroidales bacterium]
MKEYSDSEIIECLRNRQGYVVSYLMDRYLPMIRLMVVQFGGTNEDARDIFQEGLMIMLEKIDDRNFVLTCKFKTLFYCVCENLWKMVLAKRKSAENFFHRKTEEESEKDPGEKIDDELYQRIFRESFDSLDELSKEILKLYWQEKSPAEIAEILGYTYGYVKKKKSEAQAELTKKVKQHPDYRKIMKLEKLTGTPVV